MTPVIIESPYAGNIDHNTAYARACLADSIHRGECPFASHLLYTQPNVLNDNDPEERKLGIQCGFAWGQLAKYIVVYCDLGISKGMWQAIHHYKSTHLILYRYLGRPWSNHQPTPRIQK